MTVRWSAVNESTQIPLQRMKELEGRPSLANISIARSFHERNGKKESLTGMLCGSSELVKKTVNRIVNHAILTNNHDVLTVIYTFAIIKVAQSRGESNSNYLKTADLRQEGFPCMPKVVFATSKYFLIRGGEFIHVRYLAHRGLIYPNAGCKVF